MRTLCLSLTMLLMTAVANVMVAQDWAALRGNDGQGSIAPGQILASGQDVELKVAWRKITGSGYSSVVVAAGKVITLYCNDTNDVIACLNADNGDSIWEKVMGPKFVGNNGSFDGPISTPTVSDDRVFVLSPTGRLKSYDLDDGAEVWSLDLPETLRAPMPLYGFTASPIVFNNTLFVLTGTPEKTVAAIDPATGELKWAAGDDSIAAQTPQLVEMEGRHLLLAPGEKKLTGLDPDNGTILFEYEHGGGNGSAVMPVQFDNNKLLLTVDDSFSKAVSLHFVDDKINVSPEWQERSIKNTYNIPVIHDGDAYAYSTRILTCVNTKTGKAKWKSRKPGDGFMIIVDGHMIVNTKQGGLHVARATPEKYEQVASLKLFDDLVWSLPAYSNGSIYLRSLNEVARVDIVAADQTEIVSTEPSLPIGPRFQNFLNSLQRATTDDQRNQLIEDFLQSQKTFPITENGIAHFVYRGTGEDVAVASDIFGARQEKKMQRVAETDLFYLPIQLPDDQRANYALLVDYQIQLDPLNPDRIVTSSVYAGEMEFAARLRNEEPLKMNWLAMSKWREPPFLKSVKSKLPEMETVKVEPNQGETEQGETEQGETEQGETEQGETEQGETKKRRPPVSYSVLVPPGYDPDGEKTWPVVYVLLGSQANKFGSFAQIAADIFNHQGQAGYPQIDPAIIVFTDTVGPALVSKIVPAIDEKYKTIATREGRSIVSNCFIASPGLTLAISNPDLFSAVAMQSPLIFGSAKGELADQIKGVTKPMRVYLDWGNYDMFNPHENWDVRSESKELYELLAENPNIELAGGQVNDSTDWSSWRNRLDLVLKHLTRSGTKKPGRP